MDPDLTGALFTHSFWIRLYSTVIFYPWKKKKIASHTRRINNVVLSCNRSSPICTLADLAVYRCVNRRILSTQSHRVRVRVHMFVQILMILVPPTDPLFQLTSTSLSRFFALSLSLSFALLSHTHILSSSVSSLEDRHPTERSLPRLPFHTASPAPFFM